MKFYIQLLTFIFVLFASTTAYSCPTVRKLIDYNCNQKLKIVFVGDSIVYGIGDTKNKNKGGYVLRLAKKIPFAQIVNLGKPGANSRGLLQNYTKDLNSKKNNATKEYLKDADLIVIDVGRNDLWRNHTQDQVVTFIRRLMKLFRTKVGRDTQSPPYVMSTVLYYTNRGSQNPFLKALNELLLKVNSSQFPVGMRMDTVSKRLLQPDRIHPTPAGYSALSKVALNYIKTTLQKKLSQLRPDLDKDGVYNYFELHRYKTDPTLFDTDGDGYGDGAEIFTFSTNPLNSNSHPDGL